MQRLFNLRLSDPKLFHECINKNGYTNLSGLYGLLNKSETKGRGKYGIGAIVRRAHWHIGQFKVIAKLDVAPWLHVEKSLKGQLNCCSDTTANKCYKIYRVRQNKYTALCKNTVKCFSTCEIYNKVRDSIKLKLRTLPASSMERQKFPGKKKLRNILYTDNIIQEMKKVAIARIDIVRIIIFKTANNKDTAILLARNYMASYIFSDPHETEKAVEGILEPSPDNSELAALKEFIDTQNEKTKTASSVKEKIMTFENKAAADRKTKQDMNTSTYEDGVSDFGFKIVYDPINDELKRIPEEHPASDEEIQMLCHIRCPKMEEIENELAHANERPDFNEIAIAKSQETNPTWECSGSVLQQYYKNRKIKREKEENRTNETTMIDLTEEEDDSKSEEKTNTVKCDDRIVQQKEIWKKQEQNADPRPIAVTPIHAPQPERNRSTVNSAPEENEEETRSSAQKILATYGPDSIRPKAPTVIEKRKDTIP